MEEIFHVDADPVAGCKEKENGKFKSGNIPTVLTKLEKWGHYKSLGDPVVPTKFIPMKTPLSNEILSNWSLPEKPRYNLSLAELLEKESQAGRRIGLILDLSNHDCLYAEDIPSSLEYKHIQLVAKELPPPDYVTAVTKQAQAYWRRNPNDYIAIHCAYGFNRTGFVVCCYLIEVCGLSVDAALASFASSRPPGVRHAVFREELHRRYEPLCPLVRELSISDAPALSRDRTPSPSLLRGEEMQHSHSSVGPMPIMQQHSANMSGHSPDLSENESLGVHDRKELINGMKLRLLSSANSITMEMDTADSGNKVHGSILVEDLSLDISSH